MKKFFSYILICSAVATLGVEVEAQNRSGKVSVRFTDPSCGDKPVKGVRVSVQGQDSSKKVRTDPNGNFELSLRPGIYTLFAQKYGFKKMNIIGVEIKSDSKFEQTYKMERGYASDDPRPGSRGYDPCKHEDHKIH